MTLTELLLVMLLLLMFTVVMWRFSSNPASNGAQLNEGVEQLTSLLRYSRAIAQQTGKVVTITFPHAAVGDSAESAAATSNDVTVSVELAEVTTMAAEVNSNIKVVQLSNEASSVTFHPDGSFDSTVIIIYSLNDNDQRRATIELNSNNLTIKQQP